MSIWRRCWPFGLGALVLVAVFTLTGCADSFVSHEQEANYRIVERHSEPLPDSLIAPVLPLERIAERYRVPLDSLPGPLVPVLPGN